MRLWGLKRQTSVCSLSIRRTFRRVAAGRRFLLSGIKAWRGLFGVVAFIVRAAEGRDLKPTIVVLGELCDC